MRKIIDFITHIEAGRWRVLLAGVLLIVGITLLFSILRQRFHVGEADVEAWLSGYRAGPYGLLATILLFSGAAIIGVPQFILIGMTVVVFGPWHGFAYSWIATVASAAATYWVGRGPVARLFERVSGRTQNDQTLKGRGVFASSFLIRNLPSAPFIVVNAGFGAVRANYWAYLAGCALGVLPKTAMIAFFGGSFVTAVRGDGVWSSLILAGIAVAALLVMLGVREIIRRR